MNLNELKEKLNLNLSSELSYNEQIRIINEKLEELNKTKEMSNEENK